MLGLWKADNVPLNQTGICIYFHFPKTQSQSSFQKKNGQLWAWASGHRMSS